MTEKVVSLSGGLILGMVFALFLGVGATQHISSPVHFEVPSVMQMTIAQTTHNNSAPAPDTTLAVNVATPVNEDSGRITRIATVTETTDPVIAQTTATTTAEPKNCECEASPKIGSELRRANLQHTCIALNTPQANTFSGLSVTTAREGNFVTIAGISENPVSCTGGHTPSFIDSKPRSHGSPTVAQNDPDKESETDPSVAGGESARPSPAPSPDLISNTNTTMRQADPPRHNHADIQSGGGSEFGPGSINFSQNGRPRPEFD
jgi:hypothetical protein